MMAQTLYREARAMIQLPTARKISNLREVEAEIAALTAELRGRPPTAAQQRELALLLSLAGKFDQATAAYEKLVALEPADYSDWTMLTSLLAYRGDAARYREVCGTMLDRFSSAKDRAMCDRIAKSCLLLPITGPRLETARQLASRAYAEGDSHNYLPWFIMCKGMAEYRAGNYDAAVRLLAIAHRRESWVPIGVTTCGVYLAMAQHRQGDTAAARQTLQQAKTVVDECVQKLGVDVLAPGGVTNTLVCLIAWREAEAMILKPPATQPQSQPAGK